MLGMLERNHAVRREQIAKYADQRPDDDLETAVRMTCAQRNRLRGVRGSTPALIALGQLPQQSGGIADEPFQNRELGNEQHVDIQRRMAAATAFVEANNARALRTAMLARGRPPPSHDFHIGDFCYYWRVQGDKTTENAIGMDQRWCVPSNQVQTQKLRIHESTGLCMDQR